MTDYEKGFIIGLIVGEGSFSGDKQQGALDIKLQAEDPEPLFFVKTRIGGKIYGIHESIGRRFWHYLLRGKELRAQIKFFYDYLPESRKRRQFLIWAKKWDLEFWEENAPYKVEQYSKL